MTRRVHLFRDLIRPFASVAAFAVLASQSLVSPSTAEAEIRRDPTGVNVDSQGATTVFITFGGLDRQVPVEATWCGELIPATPDVGFRCDPATLFGRLPIRFDQSRLGVGGTVFTDIMSIPPSVARRAYQAAERGATSSFFYVRRFVDLEGGPDEYVFVTCRLSGGGARVPLALLDVQLSFADDETVLSVPRGSEVSPVRAEIAYNGTGRLEGRWEVVFPGDDPPASRDLLTEATLPPAERQLQRRYTQVQRFNIFLPPTGRVVLEGPDPSRLPTEVDGLHQILLRIEASDDKEGDSNLANAGAGDGVVHSGAVAGFPLPVLRYFVGSAGDASRALARDGLALLSPADGADLAADLAADLTTGSGVDFAWSLADSAIAYRLEVESEDGVRHAALVQQGIGIYRAPPWWLEGAAGDWRWRVVALGPELEEMAATDWRSLTFSP